MSRLEILDDFPTTVYAHLRYAGWQGDFAEAERIADLLRDQKGTTSELVENWLRGQAGDAKKHATLSASR